jgi:hypothetical protein
MMWVVGRSVVGWELPQSVPGVSCYWLGAGDVDKLLVVAGCESEWRVRGDESAGGQKSKSLFDWRFVVVDDHELVVVVTRQLCYSLDDYCYWIVDVGQRTFMLFRFRCSGSFKRDRQRCTKVNLISAVN